MSAPAAHAHERPTLALLCGWMTGAYWEALIDAVEGAARRRGADLRIYPGSLVPPGGHPEAHLDAAKHLADVRGVLVANLGNLASQRRTEEFLQGYEGLPRVGLSMPGFDMGNVQVDNAAALRAAVQHLVRVHGRRRVAFVRAPINHAEGELRLMMFQEAIQAEGLTTHSTWLMRGSHQVDETRRLISAQLRRHPPTFDALVAFDEMAAIGAMDALLEHRIDIPGGVAIIGIDDLGRGRVAPVPLTTLRQPMTAMADQAVATLLRLTDHERLTIPPTEPVLVVRDSCGCSTTQPAVTSCPDNAALGLEPGEVESLCEEAGKTASDGTSVDAFRRTLQSRMTRGLGRSRQPRPWQDLATFLESRFTQASRVPGRQVGDQVRLSLLEAQYRNAVRGKHDMTDRRQRLAEAANEVVGSHDWASLGAALVRRLPELGISTFYLIRVLGEDSARVEVACENGERTSAPLRSHAPHSLLPAGFRRRTPRRPLVVQTLSTGSTVRGYFLSELESRDGVVYDVLHKQIVAALDRL